MIQVFTKLLPPEDETSHHFTFACDWHVIYVAYRCLVFVTASVFIPVSETNGSRKRFYALTRKRLRRKIQNGVLFDQIALAKSSQWTPWWTPSIYFCEKPRPGLTRRYWRYGMPSFRAGKFVPRRA